MWSVFNVELALTDVGKMQYDSDLNEIITTLFLFNIIILLNNWTWNDLCDRYIL